MFCFVFIIVAKRVARLKILEAMSHESLLRVVNSIAGDEFQGVVGTIINRLKSRNKKNV